MVLWLLNGVLRLWFVLRGCFVCMVVLLLSFLLIWVFAVVIYLWLTVFCCCFVVFVDLVILV